MNSHKFLKFKFITSSSIDPHTEVSTVRPLETLLKSDNVVQAAETQPLIKVRLFWRSPVNIYKYLYNCN